VTFAHDVVRPDNLWQAWNLAPPVVLGIAIAALTYGLGVIALRRNGHGPGPRRVLCFYAGLAVVVGSLVAPLDALATTLFSAHMVQDLMLILIAAPLLVLGAPLVPVTMAMPRTLRRIFRSIERVPVVNAASRAVMNPVVVLALHSLALWAWHLPSPYQAALGDDVLHGGEHVTFVATAMLFWALVIGSRRRRRLGHGPAILLTFVTALQSAALGVVLTFASTVLYPVHAGRTQAWGLTALEDQQLAGVFMSLEQASVFFAVFAFWVVRFFAEQDDEAPAPA
jgi:putative membrane protein